MTAHTPLPWHYSKRNGKPDQIIGADGSLVCEGLEWNDNGEANARLIAAAPELLQALTVADECLALIQDAGHAAMPYNVTVARGTIAVAIAKAKEATP